MTIIDHRILIPAAPDVVWDYISDITRNPDWQVDCRDVIFLTSRREGPGVRWRYAAPNGHEYVIAVTAWYNGLGYEYYLVDGAPYRENKGRIRLQEIPEGTIVQWTFTYELGGVFGGMRNALGVNRQVDQTIAESLKMLWQKIKQSGAASRPHEAKSLMRDAPNVDARSTYQPRHPSTSDRPETQKPVAQPVLQPQAQPLPVSRFQSEPPISADDAQAISIIDEPPIKQDDTKPRPAATLAEPARVAEPVVPPDLEGEPDFLDRAVDLSRFEPPRDPSDTQPRRPVTPPTEPVAPTAVAEPEPPPPEVESRFAPPRTPTPAPEPLVGEETEPLATPAEVLPEYRAPLIETAEPAVSPSAADIEETKPRLDEVKPEPPAPVVEEKSPEPEVEAPAASIVEPVLEAPPAPAEPVVEQKPPAPMPEPKPTGENASIWEIFGVPRPSETQEAAAVKAESSAPIAEPKLEPALAVSSAAPVAVALPVLQRDALPRGSSRIGLRIVLRRKLVRLRRP